ncbi:hypothetical protein [Hoeflea alexandrii]|uniref:Uncharacterized protein n=1 Tax=Hoeflea alexandrii TaxID=288436 RepID=A0ABT1CTG0_9HYPH|nr:hypothetical protein [Hoeflea alexandrii]MCO6409489.1 hypothetical protein [Hoeflea alexandrii]MCY0152520.1 hypothetical protein [Hoeflea alexandrii]
MSNATMLKRISALESRKAERAKKAAGSGVVDYEIWQLNDEEIHPTARCVLPPEGTAHAHHVVMQSIPSNRYIDPGKSILPFWCRSSVIDDQAMIDDPACPVVGSFQFCARGPNLVPLRGPLTTLEINNGGRQVGSHEDMTPAARLAALEPGHDDVSDVEAATPLVESDEVRADQFTRQKRMMDELIRLQSHGCEVIIDLAVLGGRSLSDPDGFADAVTVSGSSRAPAVTLVSDQVDDTTGDNAKGEAAQAADGAAKGWEGDGDQWSSDDLARALGFEQDDRSHSTSDDEMTAGVEEHLASLRAKPTDQTGTVSTRPTPYGTANRFDDR